LNVLSLFDGISCGQVALERAGIQVDTYYASEIDKYAIQIAQKNYSYTVQLGDVNNINFKDYTGRIDLLIGGSPCQGFSKSGKGLNFDDPRSKLFFNFVEALRIIKPTYFLLENVVMKQEWKDIISEYLGVKPTKINSELVSAQSRERFYWTNIPNIEQPQDKQTYLKDIVLSDVEFVKKDFIHSPKAIEYMNRTIKDGRNHWDFGHHSDIRNDKSATVVANFFKGVPYNVFKDWDCIRKFHPIECERLQTLPDNYTEGVSDTQRYKMIGNGWTVDVIAHIFKSITK
jgi:DNA-cytosine methyltransferase